MAYSSDPSRDDLEARLALSSAMVRRLHLQYEVAGILAEAESIHDALHDVLMTLGRTKGWNIAQSWIFDDDQTQFQVWHDSSRDLETYIQHSRSLDLRSVTDAPAAAMTGNDVLWVDDIRQHTGYARHAAAVQAGICNVLVFPLVHGQRVFGVVELASTQNDPPESGFRQLFRLLGRDIARFLEAMQYEHELEKKNTRLAQAQRIARMGHWEWRPQTNRLKINGGTLRALGYCEDELAPETLEAYLARLPEADRTRLQAALGEIADLRLGELEFEHAFESPDGNLRLIVLRAEAQTDRHGRLNRVVGMVQDVTERRRAELQMRASERRWESVFKNSPVPGLVTDAQTGECLAANVEFLEWFGTDQDQVLGKSTTEIGLWAAEQPREYIVRQLKKKGYLRHYEVQVNSQKGPRSVLMSVECLDIDERDCYLVKFVDISERKALETQLRLIASAVNQAAEAMVILDAQGIIVSVNPAFTRITGYAGPEAEGQPMDVLLNRPTGLHDDDFFRRIVGYLLSGGHWEGEVWAQRKNGEVFPELLSISVIRDDSGKIVNYVGVFNDITDQKAQEEKLKQLALYDSLTGLPNRTLLKEHLEQAIARAKRQGAKVAVIFCDLDRFKPVNDTFGHEVGDEVLKEVAKRLRRSVRASDMVARLGGDEFVVVLETIAGLDDVSMVAQKMVDALSVPFAVLEQPIEIGTSAGIALYPDHGEAPNTLIRRADEALYMAKDAGRATYRFWQPS